MFYKMTDGNRYGQFEIDSKQESKVEEEDFIEQKVIELSSAMNVSVECARGHIMEAMREHSPEEKARYKKELEERS